MKKAFFILLICILTFSGCGKNQEQDQTAEQEQNTDQDQSTSQGEDVTVQPIENEEPEIQEGVMDAENSFDCGNYVFTCIGLKEYGKLEGEDYTDIPEDGNVYLVMFVNVKNQTADDLYFTPNELTATVDGQAVENTFLVNDPAGYESVFRSIGFRNEWSGYIVWQVPENWSEFSYEYNGLSFSDNISVSGSFTRESMFDPPENTAEDL